VNLLLDTHAFLWWATGDARVPREVERILREPGHDVYVSAVSMWELAVKALIGKLRLPMPVSEFITDARSRLEALPLPFEERAIIHLAKLPNHHRDPFDRMLICQAIEHDLMLVTADEQVKRYPVKTYWAQ
jgi:PIN domain nuclease of toxin-antitoxin system